MNRSSFASGLVFATAALAALYLTLPPVEPFWRQCAPAQNDEQLVSTVQHKDRTECNYSKKPSGRAVQRKGVVS